MEKFESQPEKKKIRAEFSFGLPGHEGEYLFVHDSEESLPEEISESLKVELGDDWSVLDRGNRIEIRNKKKSGLRDDERIKAALERAVDDRYNLHITL